jgi:hypothetical protein
MPRLNYDHFERISVAAPVCRFGVSDVLKDCTDAGLIDELRAALSADSSSDDSRTLRVVRDLIYELASSPNRDLAVDALIYATGIADFQQTSLRISAQKHGLTAEGFRLHVLGLQRRLHLPVRRMQRHAA